MMKAAGNPDAEGENTSDHKSSDESIDTVNDQRESKLKTEPSADQNKESSRADEDAATCSDVRSFRRGRPLWHNAVAGVVTVFALVLIGVSSFHLVSDASTDGSSDFMGLVRQAGVSMGLLSDEPVVREPLDLGENDTAFKQEEEPSSQGEGSSTKNETYSQRPGSGNREGSSTSEPTEVPMGATDGSSSGEAGKGSSEPSQTPPSSPTPPPNDAGESSDSTPPPPEQSQQPALETVSVSVSVSSAKADGSVSGGASPTFEKGATAYDALRATGLSVEMNGSYVTGIGGLREKDPRFGTASGWVYFVNGAYADRSSTQWMLNDGDQVQWVYTTGDLRVGFGSLRASKWSASCL